MNQDILQRLREPFPFDQVETKIQVTSQDKTKGMAIFYHDARAVQERLDTVLSPFGWKNEYIPWQNNAQLCGLSIFDSERNEWITKYDGAENSDIEPIKGGLSDAFKRAATQWGIGRYLYEIPSVWVEIEQRGKGSYIKDNQRPKLEAEYNRAIARIFNSAVPQPKAPPAPIQQQAPAPVQQQTPPPINNQQPTDVPASEYRVQSVKPSGKESQLLELVTSEGEVVSAYVRNSDEGIKAGSRLRDVSMTQKQSSYGLYNLISGYQIAA